ncbi:hypothetical protein [Roseateles noduli]|uniref:hypothetical protein n=1 Tax=Roseateles noduli TaxID=2052484 RepID=UPI003D65726D
MKRQMECTSASLDALLESTHAIAFLDANILVPQYLRSTFLDLAQARLFHPRWTSLVLEETRRNLLDVEGRYRLHPAAVEKLFKDMERSFPDAMVGGADPLMSLFDGKTDVKDRHVAAGALRASLMTAPRTTVVLVSHNIRDLPQGAFDARDVLVATPDHFLRRLIARFPAVACGVLSKLCARFRRPPVSKQVFLALLAGSGCRRTASTLAGLWGFEA